MGDQLYFREQVQTKWNNIIGITKMFSVILPWDALQCLKCLSDPSQQTFVGFQDVLKISVSNKSKCVSNKSIFPEPISDKSKMN